MIKRALVAAAVTAVVACVALLLWSVRRATYDVVGRLGSPGGPVMTPEQSATKVKLGTATRSAVRATAEPFEVDLGEPGVLVVFSFGVRYLDQERPNVRFVVEANGPGGWLPAFDETVSKPSPGEGEGKSPLRPWRDRVVNLEEVVPGARRVRFRATAEGGHGQDVEAYWGSVLALRRKGPLARLQEGWRALFQRREPPNVIVISLDTLSARHLTSFGNVPGVSPSIDRFLRESFSFSNAVAQYPNTLVSHASLFTGLYPKNHGVYSSDPFLRSETLASRLAARGYVTAAITEDAYVDSGFGFDGGFDWYENGRVKDVTQISGHAKHTFSDAIAWLYSYGAHTKFFLFVHTYEVHTPYAIQTKGAERIVEAIDPGYAGPFARSYPAGLFEMAHNFGNQLLAQPELRHLPALYAGEISYLDRVFGRFMRQLSRMPFADRTLVVVLADHGEEFGEHGKLGHGETLCGQALHVPLGFRWTGTIQPCSTCWGSKASRVSTEGRCDRCSRGGHPRALHVPPLRSCVTRPSLTSERRAAIAPEADCRPTARSVSTRYAPIASS
jgi:hypothetical protein